MASIIMADTTGRYDGRSLGEKPLGGTEANVILCAQELAKRGHAVTVHTHCEAAVTHEGVRWRPLSETPDSSCDAFVAIQHAQLLSFVPNPRRRAIWVLWGANQLRHYKKIWRLWLHRPTPILMSQYQVSQYWPILPRSGPLPVIPLPLPDDVRGYGPKAKAPAPHAIFASNPQRNLKALVEIWVEKILPLVPNAILDVYGVHSLREGEDAWQAWAGSALPTGVPEAARASVRVHPTAARPQLLEAMREARVMLYLGHKCEAFCMSLAEAQALGTPAVIAPIAALPERVIAKVTGFHAADGEAFAKAAVRLLTDDALWRRQHEAALERQQGITCAEYAERFEAALFGASPHAAARAAAA